MEEIKFEIIKNLGVIGEGTKGWKKEINLVSWNGRKPKLDIRDWDENHLKMGKGVTLSREECLQLESFFKSTDVSSLEF